MGRYVTVMGATGVATAAGGVLMLATLFEAHLESNCALRLVTERVFIYDLQSSFPRS